jgi:dihydrofolate reductase
VIVSLIAAMDLNRGIGFENRIPWRLSADLRRFRDLTMGHHIIVGRKTFESIGRALPGRQTIIVTRNDHYQSLDENSTVVHSIEEAIDLASARGESEVFVCGGAEIYRQALDLADRLYLTVVEAETQADTFFPKWNEDKWSEKESLHLAVDDKNQYPSTFKVFVKAVRGA